MTEIITVTLNPAVDKSTRVEHLVPEQKLHCETPKYESGGGGINVSRALRRLGTTSKAIFPAGGRTGQLLQELLEIENIDCKIVPTRNETRENFIVVESSTNQQFRFGMPGPELFPHEVDSLLGAIEQESPKWIIISGSLPPGVDPRIMADIAAVSKAKQAKLIVDTSGDALSYALEVGVTLLKPNLGELSKLVGVDTLDNEAVDDAAKELINKGACEMVVVSMGPWGAHLVTKDVAEHIPAPAVKKLSTVGAGDSMLAGMVHSLSLGCDLKEVARMGVACGTAATMNPGTELFKIEDVKRLHQWLMKTK